MTPLALHDYHAGLHARFQEVNGMEVVQSYGDYLREYSALRSNAGVLDLGFRGRLVLTGADRVRFLNGQVTNNVKDLPAGQGCYAAIVTNKGRMQSDANIHVLADEILLDFEPGLTHTLSDRLSHYIIADDVQVVDVAPYYGLLGVQGPASATVLRNAGLDLSLPSNRFESSTLKHPSWGEIYCMNQRRLGLPGFDLFVPAESLASVVKALVAAAEKIGGYACGWKAFEVARIEAGIPRFTAEMDETNLPPEAGIENQAISYTKGCYIGQEIIARIRTYGQVAKALRGLRFGKLSELPARKDKVFLREKEVGYVCSSVHSLALAADVGMAYIRRESNEPGTELMVATKNGPVKATVVTLPFVN